MKKFFASAFALFVIAFVVCGCAQQPTGAGWTTLIDGEKGIENWTISGIQANWRAADGAIQADAAPEKGVSVLLSKRSFKDFELHVEFWADHDTNSGIYLRVQNPQKVSTSTGAYEAQIWDKNPKPDQSTGALLPLIMVNPIYKAGGRWNTYDITAQGTQITVKLNGVTTGTTNDAKLPGGPIGIQFNPGTGPIKVRKLLVREL